MKIDTKGKDYFENGVCYHADEEGFVNTPGKQTEEEDTADPDKEALVAKLLALKEAHPKIVKAAPSQIPAMSAKTLTKLIAEAEAAIAAGNQE